MSVVQPGSGQSRGGGQRPGGRPPGQPGRSSKPPVRGAQPSRSANGQAGQRPRPGQKPSQKPGQQAKGKRNVPVQAAPPRRISPTTLAFAAIGVVVVVVVAFVIVKVTGGSSGSSGLAPTLTPASPTVVAQLTGVGESVMNSVGVPSSSVVSPPSILKGQSPLKFDGKPGALFIGAEYCPYCGAERWAEILAFSKFGTFTGLQETTSSPWDVDPDTPTFSFKQATYTSSYVTFRPIEYESNATGPNGAGIHVISSLTSQEQSLWNQYESHFGVQSGSVPFLDIGNKLFVTSPSYNPQVLAGLNQDEVASKLTKPSDPVTQSIVGTANYLIAGICSITQDQPSSVCSTSAVMQASHALSLS